MNVDLDFIFEVYRPANIESHTSIVRNSWTVAEKWHLKVGDNDGGKK
jgi:hypothetical protein